jgi:hypothetical protein
VAPGAFQHPIRIDNTQGLACIQAAAVLRTLSPRARFIFLANRALESIAINAQPGERQLVSSHDQAIAWSRGMEQWVQAQKFAPTAGVRC